MLRRTFAIGVVALLPLTALATLGGCDRNRSGAQPGDGIELDGDDLGLATLAGLGTGAPPVELADFRGAPVVLNFFASTCAPCVREMPALESVHRAAGASVAFVGVAVADRPDDALALAADTGVTYQLAADPQGELFTSVGAPGLPATVVLDAEGTVVTRHFGEIDAEGLVDVLASDAGVTVVLG